MKEFIPYARQSITDDDIEEVTKTLSSGIITRGPKVTEFEQAIAHYCGAKHAVAFNSGTTALQAACHAAKISPHDRIITSPNTFVGTFTAGTHYGATNVFVDIDAETGNVNLDQVIESLEYCTTRGKNVILPVHYSGIPVDVQQIEKALKHPDAIIIEDAAHALGSSYSNGEKVGSCAWSQMTIFSFHPAKTITTGEGGMVTTNDEELYLSLQSFRNNGITRDPNNMEASPGPWYYEVKETTGNYNFTDFQAALGLSQFNKLESFVQKRRRLIEVYREKLDAIEHVKMSPPNYDPHTAYHLCAVKIDFQACGTTRAAVMEELKNQGIGTQVHYIPVYHHPFFRKNNADLKEYFPEMEAFYSQELSLPLFSDLTEKDVDMICRTLQKTLAKNPAKIA